MAKMHVFKAEAIEMFFFIELTGKVRQHGSEYNGYSN